jgi:tetratricopeptide (TPR) repeat protein
MKKIYSIPIFPVAAGLVLAACVIYAQMQPAKSKPQASAPAARNPGAASSLETFRSLGKAYYEQGKYVEAVEQFQKVVASGKALAGDHMNLGVALILANNLDQALGELATARQIDPKLTATDYNLGILYKRELRYPDAEASLKRVIEADSADPAAWFNLGYVYFNEKKLEESLAAFHHVIDLGFSRGQNFYVASLFRSFTVLVRLKRQDEAQKVLAQWEKMRDKVPNISLQDPALEAGKYGAIIEPPASPPASAGRLSEEKATFLEITERLRLALPGAGVGNFDARQPIKASDYSLEFARRNLVPLFGASIAVEDYDNDGHPDLYVVAPSGSNHLFHNNGDGTFTDVTEKAGVAGPGASLSATFADFDNSGKTSLFVVGLGGVRVYRYAGDGVFHDETERAGLKPQPGELATRAVLFDSTNDGYLDLFVTAYTDLGKPPARDSFLFPKDFPGAVTHYYRNNGDGSFTEVTSGAGLAAARGRMRGAAFADFSNHGYNDLLLFRDDGPPLLFENQGEGKFQLRRAWGAGTTVALDAQVADFNHDGLFDLVLWSPEGYRVLMNRGNGNFTSLASALPLSGPADEFAFRGAVADVNGDGFPDLLAAGANGKLHLLVNNAGKFREGPVDVGTGGDAGLAALAPGWLENPGQLDLVATTRRGQLRVYQKQGPPAHWVEVKMSGFKSNNQGIGSVVEFKAGNYYNKVVVTASPLRVFTDGISKLDVIRVTWPNAVVQNWIDVETGRQIDVRESERLASSCPLLYRWDGTKFVFATDVLGVGPLGELAPDGTRIKPFPEDLVRLPALTPDMQGNYTLQLTDELREVDYFDQVKLLAVDHPADEAVYSNEIYASNPGPAKLFAVRAPRIPLSAVDDQGHDVLPQIRDSDGRYPVNFARRRILGMADLHSLTLDLGELPAGAPVSLWLKGWVFWTDSNGARALASGRQGGMISPYLQVRDASGKWTTVIDDMGLPSGTNRTMRVDLAGKFLSSDHHVRIVTNLCIYWDQIFFTTEEGPAPAPLELPLAAADLHYRGFSTPASDPAHLKPDSYDYLQLLTAAPWNPMRGNYTRYGAVDKLLERADDQLVVMATGDEMTVKFTGAKLPPVKPGWKRDFFLDLRGWAKDGEPNTAFAWTVVPLPFRKMSNYPPGPEDRAPNAAEYQQYLREFETRRARALIPPLAPAIH